MADIQKLFKETIAEFMENGLKSELQTIFVTASTTTKTKREATAGTDTADEKRFLSDTCKSNSPIKYSSRFSDLLF